MILAIGNRNYSSWSLRPWLLMRRSGLEFDVVDVPLDTEATPGAMLRWSPTGRVPVLRDGDLVVWDSLAICEHVAELAPGLWPADRADRAVARAMAAEMHSGFPSVRATMPMNCRRRVAGFRPDAPTRVELGRIDASLGASLERSGGAWLAGDFGVVDAMYAPVASRLRTYAVTLSAPVEAWIDRLLETPEMREWYAAAAAEQAVIEAEEIPDGEPE